MICTKCGFTNAQSSKFCIFCGEHLAEPINETLQDLDPLVCPVCREENEGHAKFCSKCGAATDVAKRRSQLQEEPNEQEIVKEEEKEREETIPEPEPQATKEIEEELEKEKQEIQEIQRPQKFSLEKIKIFFEKLNFFKNLKNLKMPKINMQKPSMPKLGGIASSGVGRKILRVTAMTIGIVCLISVGLGIGVAVVVFLF